MIARNGALPRVVAAAALAVAMGAGPTNGIPATGASPAPSGSPATFESPAPLTPEAVYLRAVHALAAEPRPAYVSFNEKVTARNLRLGCSPNGVLATLKHGDTNGTYLVWFRTRDEASVSEDAATHARCNGALLYPTGATVATLGAASPSPSPSPQAAGGGAQGDASALDAGPALIASVRADAVRFYAVSFAGDDAFEGHRVYRLALRAYRAPNDHPLTGMVVDAETFLPRQVTGEVAGHYVVANGRVAGTVTFDREGPYWMLERESFDFAMNALLVHARCAISVVASDIAFPDSVPVALPTPSAAPSPH